MLYRTSLQNTILLLAIHMHLHTYSSCCCYCRWEETCLKAKPVCKDWSSHASNYKSQKQIIYKLKQILTRRLTYMVFSQVAPDFLQVIMSSSSGSGSYPQKLFNQQYSIHSGWLKPSATLMWKFYDLMTVHCNRCIQDEGCCSTGRATSLILDA